MPHISYSELKNWNHCPFYHKLVYLDKVTRFEGNEYTAFGNVIHDVCEKKLLLETIDDDFFVEEFKKRLKKLESKNVEFDIDAVIKVGDKYHIVDWKTCSWGWNAKRRSEPITTYQLTLYKKFFCQKHKIDPKNVETHFALLKRTAKENRVEIFRVTSGPRKTENALKLLKKALYNIVNGKHIKNRLSCYRCELHKTEYCP